MFCELGCKTFPEEDEKLTSTDAEPLLAQGQPNPAPPLEHHLASNQCFRGKLGLKAAFVGDGIP